MIQKKNLAARITDVEVVSELLKERNNKRPDSPDSKTTNPPQSEHHLTAPEKKLTESAPFAQPVQHHPQVIDQDVENFTTRLDTLICQFRNESLKEFLTVKRSILHDQISTIESEKKRCNALVSSKQDEIQHLTEHLSKTTKAFDQDESQKDALSLMIGTFKMRHLALRLKGLCYLSWLSYHRHKSHKKKTLKLVNRLYRKSVINYVFIPWKANWKRFSAGKAQKRFNEALEAEKASISMHFNKEIEMLRSRIYEAERKVQTEEEAKVAVQEHLKKAFIRGVCAMNFEAMNILNPGSDGGGAVGAGSGQAGVIDFFDAGIAGQAREEGERRGQRGQIEQREQRPVMEFGQIRDNREVIEANSGSPVKGLADFCQIESNLIAESKELKWKAAPVFGRPQTAQVACNDGIMGIGLPVVNAGIQSEGKVIVVNNLKTNEIKISGKVPVKTAVVKKSK